MPKKNSKDSSEAKKRRTSSSAKDRNASTTSPLTNDVLLPPTPTASHLVASNPFDDPPSNNMNNPGPMMQGPPRMMMHSPMHNTGMISPGYGPGGPHGSRSPWGSSPMGPSPRQIRPYGSPGGPGWNMNPGGMVSPMSHMVPNYQHDPQMMSPTEYSYNRQLMSHPNPTGQPMYRGGPPPRMLGRFGDSSPPMNSDRIPVPRMHMQMHGMPLNGNPGLMPNQMKVLTRPGMPSSLSQPVGTRKMSGKSDKLSRTDSGSTTPKAKKKSKAAEAKAAKSALNEIESNQTKHTNGVRQGGKLNLSSPSGNGVTPPHVIPPVLPQTCFQCHKKINYPLEDCICCLASCNIWYHLSCTGLTEGAYNCLKGEELALWACDNCLRIKEIDSVRLRDTAHSDLSNVNSNGNGLAIIGKA